MLHNPILDANNLSLIVANFLGGLPVTTLNGLPLGSTGDSALGEIFLKVGIVGGTSTQLTGEELTVTSSVVTGNGTVTAGKRHIEFVLSSSFVGTINGISYTGSADSAQSFDAPPGYTFAAIPYTISAGSARLHTW